jgi:hypothetical protein
MGHGSRGRQRRRDLLGAGFAPLTGEKPGSSVREYLNVEQLSEVTPWTVAAIEKMVIRGTLRLNLHYYQPFGPRTQLVFKWRAIVALIEGDRPKSDDTHNKHIGTR